MTASVATYKLRPFQEEVAERFVFQKDTRSVLIGDDMGLGKTYEALDLDWQRRLKDNLRGKVWRPTLVLTNMSVVPAWEETYEQALPNLRVVTLDPKARASFLEKVKAQAADVYIMHWDALRLMEPLRDVKWFHIIADEVHRIKNRKSRVTRCLKSLKTTYKTGMSGTPADNKPHDLWSILNWLYPNEYRAFWSFDKKYVRREMSPQGYTKVVGVRNVDALHKEMSHYYIRRRKAEVARDLPDKYYSTLWVDLTPSQRRQYNGMKKNMLAWVGAQDQDKPLAAPGVITQLLRLQQFSCASVDVETVTKKKLNKDWEANRELWRAKHGDIPFPEHRAEYHKWNFVDVQRYFMLDPSSKLDAAMALIEDSADDQPIVFFSQFKTMINLFGERLKKAGISHCLLTGDATKDERGEMIRNFQAGKIKVFAGTIKAGGEGITLTRSSHVVFFDRSWSPSKNIQAEDRLHRIGQKDAVQVTDIMARNTLDMGRAQQIQQKWTWLQMMLGDKTLDYQKKASKIDPGDQELLDKVTAAMMRGRQ